MSGKTSILGASCVCVGGAGVGMGMDISPLPTRSRHLLQESVHLIPFAFACCQKRKLISLYRILMFNYCFNELLPSININNLSCGESQRRQMVSSTHCSQDCVYMLEDSVYMLECGRGAVAPKRATTNAWP